MEFLKILGLLSILVTSNPAFAMAIFEELHHQGDSSNNPQIQEEMLDLGESILTGSHNFPGLQSFPVFSAANFNFRGSNSVQIANDYIRYSATIKPSLDIQKVIFPFHTFL